MSEPTLPVPVSLIEDARDAIDAQDWEHADLRAALSALLSQPTPTAGQDRVVITRNQIENGVREVIEDGEWSDADDLPPLIVNAILFRSRYLPDAEPPRIEDLAPGTTFSAETSDGLMRADPSRWLVLGDGRLRMLGAAPGVTWNRASIDPSTIRDVIPPTN